MVTENPDRPVRVSRINRFDKLGMFVGGSTLTLSIGRGHHHVALARVPEHLEMALQYPLAAHREHREMKLTMCVQHLLRCTRDTSPGKHLHSVQPISHTVCQAPVTCGGRTPGGDRFDLLENLEGVPEVLFTQLPNDGPAAREIVDERLSFELADCFSQRHPTDSELTSEIVHPYLRPRR